MLNVILFLIYLLHQCCFVLNIFRSLFCLVCVLFTYLDLFIYLRLLGPSPLITKPNCPIHNSNTPLPKTPKITPHFFSHTRHACLLGENSLHDYFTMLPLAWSPHLPSVSFSYVPSSNHCYHFNPLASKNSRSTRSRLPPITIQDLPTLRKKEGKSWEVSSY